MREFSFLILSFMMFSCSERKTKNIVVDAASSDTIQTAQSDTVNWINSFREFRDAVYRHDKMKTKQFFDFPIMSDGNEIWVLVYINDYKKIAQIHQKIKPFTETDFDQHFDDLFSSQFIKSILKIKTEEFYKTGQTETANLSEGKNTTYSMSATLDIENNTFDLYLGSTIRNEGDDDGELGIKYEFKILENGQIKFLRVSLAG